MVLAPPLPGFMTQGHRFSSVRWLRQMVSSRPGGLGPPHEWPALLLPSALHHPSLLLLMALSPSEDLSGLCLLFEPVWLGSLHVVLHPQGPREEGPPHLVPGLLPSHLLLQVLEALLFLQALLLSARQPSGRRWSCFQLLPKVLPVAPQDGGGEGPRGPASSCEWSRCYCGEGRCDGLAEVS